MKIIATLILTAAVVLSGCQSTNLESRTYVKPGHDISSFSRYAWDNKQALSNLGVLFGSEQKKLELTLKKHTVGAMAERGYHLVNANDNPEFLVSFVAGAMEQAVDSQHNYQKNRMNLNTTYVWSQTNEFLQGGISVSFSDLSGEDILWQGTATRRIKSSEMRRQDGSMVRELLNIIMTSLPAAE